jgi:hypothetical protein
MKNINCPYYLTCHFFNIKEMSPHSRYLEDKFCFDVPERCEIYKKKSLGKPVPITLWPMGQVI